MLWNEIEPDIASWMQNMWVSLTEMQFLIFNSPYTTFRLPLAS